MINGHKAAHIDSIIPLPDFPTRAMDSAIAPAGNVTGRNLSTPKSVARATKTVPTNVHREIAMDVLAREILFRLLIYLKGLHRLELK